MAERETVKVATPDHPEREWVWKAKENLSDEDALFAERESMTEEEQADAEKAAKQVGEEIAAESNGQVDWQIADNGWWTITVGGEEVDKGRGEEALDDALKEYGIDR